MNKIARYKEFKESALQESFWNSIFGKPSIGDAARSSYKGKGFSHVGKENTTDKEANYIMFDGQKFYPEDIVYDDYDSTKPLPRVEGGKLIIANPAWSL